MKSLSCCRPGGVMRAIGQKPKHCCRHLPLPPVSSVLQCHRKLWQPEHPHQQNKLPLHSSLCSLRVSKPTSLFLCKYVFNKILYIMYYIEDIKKEDRFSSYFVSVNSSVLCKWLWIIFGLTSGRNPGIRHYWGATGMCLPVPHCVFPSSCPQ